jgi:hypothetical protein
MSYAQPLSDREHALEEAFFRKEGRRLLAAMRERDDRRSRFEALSKVLGLRDAGIIDPLLDLGMREESVTALVMAPLVAVAWADRTLDTEERHLLLEAEKDFGIDPDGEAGHLLADWLEHRPHAKLMDAWSAYVHELCNVLEPTERDRLRDDVATAAWRIALALEKSFFRESAPTSSERVVLARIEEAFRVGERSAVAPDPVLTDAVAPPMT